MADDIELLRLRAKAKLKLRSLQGAPPPQADNTEIIAQEKARPIGGITGILNAPGAKMGQAVEQMTSGEPIAGGINAVNALAQTAALPFSLAGNALKRIPGMQPIVGAAETVMGIPAGMVRVGQNVIDAGLKPFGVDTSPSPTSSALSELNQNMATAIAYPVARRIGEVPNVISKTSLTPEKLAAKSGKFTGSPDQVLKKANIALRENINPTNIKALEKLDNVVTELDNRVGSYAKSEDFMKTNDILRYIDGVKERVSKSQITPEQSILEIEQMVSDVYKQRGMRIPADLAHQLKKGIYQREKAAYETQSKTGKLPGVDTQAEMAIAKGILGEWEKLYPETKPLLKREADLLSIRNDVRKAVRQEIVKSNLPESLLLAFSPKWWMTKMIATNKNLEFNLARVLYRARGGGSPIPQVGSSTPIPPPHNPIPTVDKTRSLVEKAGLKFETYQRKPNGYDVVVTDPETGSTFNIDANNRTISQVLDRIQEHRSKFGK